MSKIVIGEDSDRHELKLDIDSLLSTRLLIQANSGGGKSFLLRRLAEQFYGKVQTIILDPEGEFFTLRETFGYVLVGQNGETPADERSAAMLAEKLLQLKASAICDLFEAFAKRPMQRRKWVATFLESLLDLPRSLWRPLVVIVDEAQKFCPQETPKAGSQEDREIISRCKDAMISLSTTGRKRSFCAVWATQRLAKVDKDATAEFFNRLVGMTIEDVDVDRAADLMSVSKEDKHDFRNSLRTLRPGQFWAFGRAITTERKLVMVGPVTTRHPEAGLAARKTEPPPAPDEVKALLPQLKDLPQAAEEKARSEAQYKSEIRDLKRQLAAAAKMKPPAAPAKAAFSDPILIRKAVDQATKPLRTQLASFQKMARQAIENFTKAAAPLNAIANATILEPAPAHMPTPPMHKPSPIVHTAPRAATHGEPMNGTGEFGRVEQNILNQLAELEALGIAKPEKAQVALMAGYTNSRSGGFTEPLAKLLQAGLVTYPFAGLVALTDEGRSRALSQERPLTRDELHERLCRKLGGPEEKILREIIATYPEEMAKETLGAKLGYTNPRSGGFTEPLGRLRALGIVDYPRPGAVKAAEWLFIEGAA